MNNNINNNGERYVLREMLKSLGRSEDNMNWEELTYENPGLAEELSIYVDYHNFNGNPLIPQTNQVNSHVKTVMCNSVKNKVVCKYGNKCKFAHTEDELKVRVNDDIPIKPVLNIKAKEYVPQNGIWTMSSLANMLDHVDDIYDTLKKVKEEKVVIDEEKFPQTVEEIAEKLRNVKFEELPIVVEEKVEEIVEKLTEMKLCDGVCKAIVASTKKPCTAKAKNGTEYCLKHKKYVK